MDKRMTLQDDSGAQARDDTKVRYLLVVRDNFIVVMALVLFVLPLLVLTNPDPSSPLYPVLRGFPLLVMISVSIATAISSRVRNVELGLKTIGAGREAARGGAAALLGTAVALSLSLVAVYLGPWETPSAVLLGSVVAGILIGISLLAAVTVFRSYRR